MTSPSRRNLYIGDGRGGKMKSNPPQHGFGANLGDRQNWVERAEFEILSLIETRLVIAHSEMEAVLSEEGLAQPGLSRRLHLDPHILSEATRNLRQRGLIKSASHSTKGGRVVQLLTTARTAGRATLIGQITRRKGMLTARLNRLSAEIGEAGEAVVRHSLTAAGDHLSAENTGFQAAPRFLGVTLLGPLDSAAWLQTRDPETGLRSLHAVPIEVKNRQQMIYPIHREIHQLLAKSAALQVAHPTHPIIPLLICRRAHSRLFWMASDLGFLVTVFTSSQQYVTTTKETDARKIREIRDELHLPYLTLLDKKTLPRIRQFFDQTIVNRGAATAARWAVTAATVLPYAEILRTEQPTSVQRQELVRELRQAIEVVLASHGLTDPLKSWSLPDLEEIEDEDGDDYDLDN